MGFLTSVGWERPYFRFFPNVKADFKYFSWTKNMLVLNLFLGNFKCFKLMFQSSKHSGGGGGGLGQKKLWTFPTFRDNF